MASKSTPSEADVIYNKYQLDLARRQRIVNSWYPELASRSEQETTEAKSDDEEFQSMSENAGLGSTVKDEGDNIVQGLLTKRMTTASRDQLLERILGKRAADAKRRDQAGLVASKTHAAPKPLNAPAKEAVRPVDDDDDDEGRTGALLSRREKTGTRSRDQTVAKAVEADDDEDSAITKVEPAVASNPPRKRKPAVSYMDELLAARSKKKSKGKAG